MKSLLKIILIKFLRPIKRALTFLKINLSPEMHENPNTPYNLYKKEEILNSYNFFKKFFKKSVLIKENEINEYAIKLAKKNNKEIKGIFLEFGVFKGQSINFFSSHVDEIFGFDSFEGLKEDWLGHRIKAGSYNLNKKIPKLKSNVIPIKGWIQDTLIKFLDEKNPKIRFVHIDTDTYETCDFILKNIKKYLCDKAIIKFDELHNYPGWDVGEYKALTENFNNEEYFFRAFSADRFSAVIEIKKI